MCMTASAPRRRTGACTLALLRKPSLRSGLRSNGRVSPRYARCV